MAEPLSTIAAATQFADLACRSLVRFYRFVKDLSDVPKELLVIMQDLDHFSEVMDELRLAIQRNDPRVRGLSPAQLHRLTRTLDLTYQTCRDLDSVLQPCGLVLSSSKRARVWGALVSVGREKDILRRVKRLECLKNDLYRDLQSSGLVMLSSLK